MFAAVFIPNFSLQAALRHEPELRARPVALIEAEATKPIVAQCNFLARQHGVTEGLTASQAIARCEPLLTKLRSRAQENSATDILLQTAFAFSPNIEATSQGVCTVELRGLGLETRAAKQTWAEKILPALAQLNLTAQIGIGPTPALALIAARTGERISIIEDVSKFISTLPLSALDPSSGLSAVLARWGIQTAGAFLALGKDNLAARLGLEALELCDRVSPDSVRPLKLVSPSREFSERVEFANEIETLEPLLFVLQRFVEQLARRIETIHLVVGEFHLQLALSNGAKHTATFKIPAPTCHVKILFRMLRTHLENVRTDATMVSAQLEATPCEPELHQFGLQETTLRNPNQFVETLARLRALLGDENAGTPVLEATHRPDSFRMTVPEFNSTHPITNLESRITNFCLRRFRPPLAARCEFRAEKPSLIRCEIFTGPVAEARGPFFGSGNWWDETRWAREEWDIATVDGLRFRIFRSNDGTFVEGMYD